jgi:hypothetical protein
MCGNMRKSSYLYVCVFVPMCVKYVGAYGLYICTNHIHNVRLSYTRAFFFTCVRRYFSIATEATRPLDPRSIRKDFTVDELVKAVKK